MAPVSALGTKAATYLKDHGQITKEDAVQLRKLAEKSGDKNEVRNLLELDAFAPGARAELAGAIGGKAPEPSLFAGMRLGTNNYGEEVRAKREIGTKAGYDDKMQAIAVARLAGAEPAAVLQGNDGKWHAVETTANFYGGGSAADTPTRAVVGLPSSKEVEGLSAKVTTLRAQSDDLQKQLRKNPNDADARAQLEEVVGQLKDARDQLAPLLFGVPNDEIKRNTNSTGRDAGKVNLNADLAATNGDLGKHGAEHAVDEGFKLGAPSAYELNLNMLEHPAGAEGVLFHENSHLEDYKLAQKWAGAYHDQTKADPTDGPGRDGKDPFRTWLGKQSPALSKADAELVYSVVHQDGAQTEARAYTHAALAALQAGAPDVAKAQLTTYAGELKKSGMPPGSEVEKALKKELETAYRQMPRDQQQQLRDIVAAAKAKNPSAWVSQLDLPK